MKSALFPSALLALLFSTGCADFRSNLLSDQVFPLQPGTVWIYNGVVTNRTAEGKLEVRSVSSRMEILKSMRFGPATIALVRGWPYQFEHFDGQTTTHLIVAKTGPIYYDVYSESAEADFERFSRARTKLDQHLVVSEPFLDLPRMKKGETFSRMADTPKDSGDAWCWVVESAQFGLIEIGGGQTVEQLKYRLRYTTNPGEDIIEFAPGIGIVSWQQQFFNGAYGFDLHLSEFHPGANVD